MAPSTASIFLSLLPFILSAFHLSSQLFPGAVPEDGDYRHLYPIVCLALHPIPSYEHTLPYVTGLLEGLRYPKDRMHLLLIVEGEEGEGDAAGRWTTAMAHYYLSTRLDTIEEGGNWREHALQFGRRKSCSYFLLTDSDSFLGEHSLRQMIDIGAVVVAPLLVGPFGRHSNMEGLMEEEFITRKELGSHRVYYAMGPLLIHLKHKDGSYLTFDESNLREYTGTGTPTNVFAFSAYAMDIFIIANNEHHYGYTLSSSAPAHPSPSQHREMMAIFLANLISDTGPMPFPHSTFLPPAQPLITPTAFGFDRVYLINLRRRPERLRKMEAILSLLGIEFTVMEAVDGQRLEEYPLYGQLHFLPNYLDPYHHRPMKRGEIGCFLSHWMVWREMVEKQLDRVIILEDDVRFTENSTQMLSLVVEDLMKTQLEWDLIYLGRKKMSPPGVEFFVRGHRYLSTVGYSYWTLGYALSLSGARKLLAARPLEKLMALDEFLPIMYDQHPRQEWKEHFEGRTLQAFAIYPVVVEPERYTYQEGYLSDTEESTLVTATTMGKKNATAAAKDAESGPNGVPTQHNSAHIVGETTKRGEL